MTTKIPTSLIDSAILAGATASFTTAQETKLAGVATGATANDTDANLKARANHTGTQSADTIIDGTANKAFLTAERTKLAGVATAASANDTDANLKARANHTGTQAASTISDFNTAADARVSAGIATYAIATDAELAAAFATVTSGRKQVKAWAMVLADGSVLAEGGGISASKTATGSFTLTYPSGTVAYPGIMHVQVLADSVLGCLTGAPGDTSTGVRIRTLTTGALVDANFIVTLF